MVETSPIKVPPNAPVDVPVGSRSNPVVNQGRNTSRPKIGLPHNGD